MRIHRWLLSIVTVCSLALLGACAEHAAQNSNAAPTTEAAAKPVNKFCAVQTENPVDDRVPTYTCQGKVIGFCCPDCVDEFKKNPDKYMATLK